VTYEIRPLRPSDREQWAALYRGYRDFYEQTPDESVIDGVWSWLMDECRDFHGVVAERDGELLGLAHWRHFDRPIVAKVAIYLDDLFVAPTVRGGGVGRALIAEVEAVARREGAPLVRWITNASNETARRLYDSVATATPYVTYDLTVTGS
jgi:GNAT superfamily N-acetyltransferase